MRTRYGGLRTLVTGGLGFLGSNLAIRLVQLGARVTVVDSFVDGCGANTRNLAPVADCVHVVRSDIGQPRRFRTLLRNTDLIFNLAGEISHIHSMRYPKRDAWLNAWAQLHFLEECVRVTPGIRIVYAGTRQIYGVPRYLPVDENHPIAPVDFNGIHNYAATMYHLLYAKKGDLDAIVLNFTNLYGPRLALSRPCQGFLGNFVRKLMTGTQLEIFGDGSQLRDPLYVDDAVDALLAAGEAQQPASVMYNAGGPEPLTIGRIAEIASRIRNLNPPVYRPFPPEQKIIDIGSYYADWRRIHTDLGWAPAVEFEDGMLRTLRYYDSELPYYLDPPVADLPCTLERGVRKKHKVAFA